MTKIMIDVLISIRPSWCRLILDGQKFVELRKSSPKAEPVPCPFRVYLYETREGRGMVVGECICWMIEKVEQRSYSITMLEGSLLSADDITAYAKRKPVYGWYLSKVTEYKTSKHLFNFGLQRAPQSWCYINNTIEV
jgi:predicted transcriptional regulator